MRAAGLASCAPIIDYLSLKLAQQGDSQHSQSEQQYQTQLSSFMRRSQYQMFVDLAGTDIAVTRHATSKPNIDSLLLIDFLRKPKLLEWAWVR